MKLQTHLILGWETCDLPVVVELQLPTFLLQLLLGPAESGNSTIGEITGSSPMAYQNVVYKLS